MWRTLAMLRYPARPRQRQRQAVGMRGALMGGDAFGCRQVAHLKHQHTQECDRLSKLALRHSLEVHRLQKLLSAAAAKQTALRDAAQPGGAAAAAHRDTADAPGDGQEGPHVSRDDSCAGEMRRCDECADPPEAGWWCSKCSSFLCEDCHGHHTRSKHTSHHRTQPVALRTALGPGDEGEGGAHGAHAAHAAHVLADLVPPDAADLSAAAEADRSEGMRVFAPSTVEVTDARHDFDPAGHPPPPVEDGASEWELAAALSAAARSCMVARNMRGREGERETLERQSVAATQSAACAKDDAGAASMCEATLAKGRASVMKD